jgi:uncharacterized membrane protein YfcA
MTILTFTLLLLTGAYLAGLVGSFTGLGGGVIIIPLLSPGAGFSIMTVAGIFSGLLGIGAGALKMLAMDSTMRISFNVSTTTSNFKV